MSIRQISVAHVRNWVALISHDDVVTGYIDSESVSIWLDSGAHSAIIFMRNAMQYITRSQHHTTFENVIGKFKECNIVWILTNSFRHINQPNEIYVIRSPFA